VGHAVDDDQSKSADRSTTAVRSCTPAIAADGGASATRCVLHRPGDDARASGSRSQRRDRCIGKGSTASTVYKAIPPFGSFRVDRRKGKCSTNPSASVNPAHAASDPAPITMRASPSRRRSVSCREPHRPGRWTSQSNLKHPFAERPAIGERRAQLSGIACSPRPIERGPDERRDRLAIVACSNL